MNKLSVKICSGTSCFVQGGSELLAFEDFLDDSLISSCNFEECFCTEDCKKQENLSPPFVRIGDKVYGNVKPTDLCRLIRENLK